MARRGGIPKLTRALCELPPANDNCVATVLPFPRQPKRHPIETATLYPPWLGPVLLPFDVVGALNAYCGEGERSDWRDTARFYFGAKVGEYLWDLAEHFARRPLGARGKLSVPDAVLYVTTRTLPEGR